MGKKKKAKTKVIHHYHDGPNPNRAKGNGGTNGGRYGVGPGRVTIDTPGISPEAIKEIKTAAGGFADKLSKIVQGWVEGGGVEKTGNNLRKSLRAVQGDKAIANQPIDVEAFDDVSIDGMLLRPDEHRYQEGDDTEGEYIWIWRNDEDISVILTVEEFTQETTILINSVIESYSVPEAEHLAQMLLSACAFRVEPEYKQLIQEIVSKQHKDHVHVKPEAVEGISITKAYGKVKRNGDGVSYEQSQTGEEITKDGWVLPNGPVGGVVDHDIEDDDWDINGVQG